MESLCQFLETVPGCRGGTLYCCGIGVNFCWVEEGRKLCHVCPVPVISRGSHCRYLDFYTFLQVEEGGLHIIEAGQGCLLKGERMADLSECLGCPHYQEASEEKISDLH